jgi:hypothetical protein
MSMNYTDRAHDVHKHACARRASLLSRAIGPRKMAVQTIVAIAIALDDMRAMPRAARSAAHARVTRAKCTSPERSEQKLHSPPAFARTRATRTRARPI